MLGTIGFLFAMTTVVLTNGKIILQRMRGEAVSPLSADAITLGGVENSSPTHSTSTAIVDAPPITPEYGGKTPIAVMPPKELGDVAEHFTAGLADDIVADLQQAGFATPDLKTVGKLADLDLDPQVIAHQLGVNHILSCSVRRQENKLRITTQLVDATGAILWSDRYNAEGDDMLAIQEHMASKVVEGVTGLVSPSNGLMNPMTGHTYSTREEALDAVSSTKSRLVALLFCIPPLGIFGAHRFYVGRPFTGTLYFLTAGLIVFGWIIDTVLIALGMFADGKGRPVRFWQPDPLKQLAEKS